LSAYVSNLSVSLLLAMYLSGLTLAAGEAK
jgi:hypothetical protein